MYYLIEMNEVIMFFADETPCIINASIYEEDF